MSTKVIYNPQDGTVVSLEGSILVDLKDLAGLLDVDTADANELLIDEDEDAEVGALSVGIPISNFVPENTVSDFH